MIAVSFLSSQGEINHEIRFSSYKSFSGEIKISTNPPLDENTVKMVLNSLV